jgi:carboxyl-terminal processing protease
MDYEHRKSDGTVNKFPDSLKREFKTTGGRKVYDGAGLDPDILVKADTYGSAVIELVGSGLVFEYATKYCGDHAVPTSFKDFKLSDEEYSKFVSWVKEQKFSYDTELDQKTEDLIASAKKEKYYDDLQPQLKDLKTRIEQNKNSALIRFKPELSKILEEEIAFHFRLTQGQIEVSLDRDNEIQEAKKILTDPVAYRKLLLSN